MPEVVVRVNDCNCMQEDEIKLKFNFKVRSLVLSCFFSSRTQPKPSVALLTFHDLLSFIISGKLYRQIQLQSSISRVYQRAESKAVSLRINRVDGLF